MLLATLLGACALAAQTAFAFNFILDDSTVNECGSVQFNWTTGVPPYKITAIGVYDVPVNMTVPDGAVTANGGAFKWTSLPFNASSQVVFVMSDASGFATGGTSKLYTVGSRPSGASDCKRTDGVVPWTFAVNPMDPETESSLPQCKPVTFTWQGDYKGAVSIVGVIPGGMVMGSAPSTGSEISYPVNVALGSEIVYAAWDSTGVTGGTSIVMKVTNGNSNCLDGSTASTTPAVPWTPTPTGGAPSKSSTKTSKGGIVTITAITTALPKGSTALTPGAIAGIVVGVIGAVLILQALILWFCCRKQVNAFLDNRKKKNARRSSGGIDLYERHPGTGSDDLLGSSSSMRSNPSRVSRVYDDELGTTISPFMGGTEGSRSSGWTHNRQSTHMDSEASPRISTASGTMAGLPGWTNLPPGATPSDHGSDLVPPSVYPPTQHNRTGSNGSSQASMSRLPMKMQLALANPDNRTLYHDGQPSPNTPVGGFRRHEDAGPLGHQTEHPPPEEVEDLPPTYNPQWGHSPPKR